MQLLYTQKKKGGGNKLASCFHGEVDSGTNAIQKI